MYRRFTVIIICLMLIVIAAASYAEDATGSISTKLDVAYVSKYVWRGIVFNPDPCLQPSLTIAHSSGASLNVWGSSELTNIYGDENKLTEIDYTLDYASTLLGRSVNGGIAHYTYPNTSFDSTTEAYATVCFDGKITTSLSANYDFDEADGLYTSVAAGYACAAPWKKETAQELNLSAKLGYGTANHNLFYFGANKAGFTDLTVSASVPLQLGKISVTPSLSYARVLDSTLRDSTVDPESFWFGLTASMAL